MALAGLSALVAASWAVGANAVPVPERTAAPRILGVESGNAVHDQYIIGLKTDAWIDPRGVNASAQELARRYSGTIPQVWPAGVHGFSANMTAATPSNSLPTLTSPGSSKLSIITPTAPRANHHQSASTCGAWTGSFSGNSR
ncbi:hypothetical protein [Kribbella sp. NBC_00359]|uniref:hypothetical protein n=1 Tax=Kribbella sp. NBC_00359 TaxID=2975966 RepID=UPI002E1DED1E